MTGRDDMVCNIEGVTILTGKSFEMLGLPVIQSVWFTDAEGITFHTTSFVQHQKGLFWNPRY